MKGQATSVSDLSESVVGVKITHSEVTRDKLNVCVTAISPVIAPLVPNHCVLNAELINSITDGLHSMIQPWSTVETCVDSRAVIIKVVTNRNTDVDGLYQECSFESVIS